MESPRILINEGRDGKKTLWKLLFFESINIDIDIESIDIKGTLWKLWFFESILSAWKTFPPHLINHDEDDH